MVISVRFPKRYISILMKNKQEPFYERRIYYCDRKIRCGFIKEAVRGRTGLFDALVKGRFCPESNTGEIQDGWNPGFIYEQKFITKVKKMAYTYIVECSDGTLYTGWTNDLKHRMKSHNAGMGAKYTRARLPVQLVYYEEFQSKQEAMKREYAIKQLTKKDKQILLRKMDAEKKNICEQIMKQTREE